MSLVRFRANPYEVRVGIKKLRRDHGPPGWMARVEPLVKTGDCFVDGPHWGIAQDPEKAAMIALEHAKEMGCPGIDLELGWTYEHPHGFQAGDVVRALNGVEYELVDRTLANGEDWRVRYARTGALLPDPCALPEHHMTFVRRPPR